MKALSAAKLKLEFSTNRIQSLNDSVFAIAMTLLVLNLRVEEPIEGHTVATLQDTLTGMWPKLVHYVESFFILSAFWIENHLQYHFIKKSDRRLFWINLLGLLFITLIPFSTSLVANYGDLKPAALFFSFNMFAAGLIYHWNWLHVTKKFRLVDKDLDQKIIRFYKIGTLVLPLVSVIALSLSLFSPRWGTLVFLMIPIFVIFFRKY